MAQSFRTAISFDGLASASSQALSIKVDGDSQNRVLIDAGGKITWGAGGSSAGDTTLYRNAANVLKTDDGFVAASLDISGNADIDGTTNLDDVDIDGTVQIDGATTFGVNDTGVDVKFFGATSGRYMEWDESEDSLVLVDNVKICLGSKAGGDGNIKHTGSNLQISETTGNIQITNYNTDGDIVLSSDDGSGGETAYITVDGGSVQTTIHKTLQLDATLNVGVDDTGYDVKFFGATASKYMLWDESADALIVKDTVDAVNFKVNGGQGSDGQVLTSTGSGVAWEDASGGGGASVTIADSAPGSPSAGNLWFESDTGKTFIYYGDGSSNQWVEVGGASAATGGANTQVQYNSSGSLAGNANFVYDGSSLITMTKSGANTGIKLDVASDTEAHSGNIAFYKSEAAGAGRLDNDAVYGQIDFYGQTASNGYHHAAAIKTLVGEYFYSDNYTPSDIEFWVTPSDQTSPVRKVVVRGGTANTDAAALEIWHNQANKGSRVDFVDDDGTQLGYFGFSANTNWYMKNLTSGNMFIESEGSIAIRAEGEYEVNFSSTGLEPYADEGYKLGSSSKEWSEAYIVDLKISGNSTMTGTLTVGVDDTGHDVKFYGAGAGDHLLWDESEGRLDVVATSGAAYFRSLNGTATTYIGSDSSNTALFGTSSAHRVRFISNDTERMTILSDSKVGIGTSAPEQNLTVKAQNREISIGDSGLNNYPELRAHATGDKTSYAHMLYNAYSHTWKNSGTNKYYISAGSYAAYYGAATNEGMYIIFYDSDSNTMSYVGSPGNDDLHLRGSASNGYLYMAAGGTWKFYTTNNSTTGFLPYSDNTFDLGSSSTRWDDVYATNGTIQTSDVNLKKDISDATLGLNFIKALRPVEYKWKDGSRKHQGFIAQEVKTVLDAQADSAEQSMWGLNTVKEGTKVMRPITDENDIPQKTEVDNEPRQSLRYTEIIAPLVKAVQELTTRLEALESA